MASGIHSTNRCALVKNTIVLEYNIVNFSESTHLLVICWSLHLVEIYKFVSSLQVHRLLIRTMQRPMLWSGYADRNYK